MAILKELDSFRILPPRRTQCLAREQSETSVSQTLSIQIVRVQLRQRELQQRSDRRRVKFRVGRSPSLIISPTVLVKISPTSSNREAVEARVETVIVGEISRRATIVKKEDDHLSSKHLIRASLGLVLLRRFLTTRARTVSTLRAQQMQRSYRRNRSPDLIA